MTWLVPGDRVFYTENGPDDTGTVESVKPCGLYQVRFDDGAPEVDDYTLDQLTRLW